MCSEEGVTDWNVCGFLQACNFSSFDPKKVAPSIQPYVKLKGKALPSVSNNLEFRLHQHSEMHIL